MYNVSDAGSVFLLFKILKMKLDGNAVPAGGINLL